MNLKIINFLTFKMCVTIVCVYVCTGGCIHVYGCELTIGMCMQTDVKTDVKNS